MFLIKIDAACVILGPQVFLKMAPFFAFMLASLGFISPILSSNFWISSVRVVPGQDALAFIEASARPYAIIYASLGPAIAHIQPEANAAPLIKPHPRS